MDACAFVTWHVCGGQRRDLGACVSLPFVNINSGGQWPVPTQPSHLPYYTNGERALKLPKGKIALVFQRQEVTPI